MDFWEFISANPGPVLTFLGVVITTLGVVITSLGLGRIFSTLLEKRHDAGQKEKDYMRGKFPRWRKAVDEHTDEKGYMGKPFRTTSEYHEMKTRGALPQWFTDQVESGPTTLTMGSRDGIDRRKSAVLEAMADYEQEWEKYWRLCWLRRIFTKNPDEKKRKNSLDPS